MTAPHDPTTGEAAELNVRFPERQLRTLADDLPRLAVAVRDLLETFRVPSETVRESVGELVLAGKVCEQALESHRQLRDRYLTEKAAWRAGQSTNAESVAASRCVWCSVEMAPESNARYASNPGSIVRIGPFHVACYDKWLAAVPPTTDGDANG